MNDLADQSAEKLKLRKSGEEPCVLISTRRYKMYGSLLFQCLPEGVHSKGGTERPGR